MEKPSSPPPESPITLSPYFSYYPPSAAPGQGQTDSKTVEAHAVAVCCRAQPNRLFMGALPAVLDCQVATKFRFHPALRCNAHSGTLVGVLAVRVQEGGCDRVTGLDK